MKPKADFLIDVSYGHIDSPKHMSKKYEKHILIKPSNLHEDLRLCNIPQSYIPAFDEMKKLGVKVLMGLSHGITTILLDYSELMERKSDIKGEYWEWFRIDSLHAGNNFDDKIIFGYAAGLLIDKLMPSFDHRKGIVHCHGWDASSCILYLKANHVKVSTIATVGSTSLSSRISDLGKKIKSSFEKESYNLGIHSQHQLEKEVALNCDTLIVENKEAGENIDKQFGRKSDAIIPRAVDLEKFPAADELALKHFSSLQKLQEFAKYAFLPYSNFDVPNTRFIFVPSINNIGKTVRSLSSLNKSLKGTGQSVIAFLFAERHARGIKKELKSNRDAYYGLSRSLEEHKGNILEQAASALLTGTGMDLSSIQLKDNFSRKGNPDVLSHNIDFEDHDTILKLLKQNKLSNNKSDNVKVLVYAVKPDKKDELLSSDPHDILAGFHAGIFDNNYLRGAVEAMALGVPILRADINQKDLNAALLDIVKNYSPKHRIEAKRHSDLHGMGRISDHYVHAHNFTFSSHH